ncbi:hypothetical protein FB45DRAFT_939826 [Roridomyces roridus]|uniref:Uncharacterized protein n=1 Tax=Roridomyces roridus TaxID=1738132 RepID=A0AAD7B778_9AGAR|nr:hypothetical protein FB45DRAFT_939826 [Roridomyces roridus]
MCRFRNVQNYYIKCGHWETLPSIPCESIHCKFSPEHPSDCVPPQCTRTCNQYHLFPENYTPQIDGLCPACIGDRARRP